MSMTPGDGGGSTIPGTAGSICTISPKDTETVLNNLISRIEKLEFNLSQILGANLHTEQLSNLSSQVGWVYNVEYMGVPGWIQTEYGTLIPPAGFTLLGNGFTLSDGNTYNAVLMDSDGVLQYGFTDDGQITGSMAGSTNNFAVLSSTLDPVYSYQSGNLTETIKFSKTYDPSGLVNVGTDSDDYFFSVNRGGWYLLGIKAVFGQGGAYAGSNDAVALEWDVYNGATIATNYYTHGLPSAVSNGTTTFSQLTTDMQFIFQVMLSSTVMTYLVGDLQIYLQLIKEN